MEARRKRKALSDCTNTIVTTAAVTTSAIKKPSTKPSLASAAFQKALANDSGKPVINSNSKPGSIAAAATDENGSESATASSTSSAVVDSTAIKSSLLSVTGECEVVLEPCSVYSRRRTADRRKSKGKEVVSSPVFSNIATRDNAKEDKITGPPKSGTVHHKKEKKDDPLHDMPQEFIEKQRAYFAEVDAYELPEEEVETIDQLE